MRAPAKHRQVYRSLMEFRKRCLPVLYREEIEAQHRKDHGAKGTGLVESLLKRMGKDTAK
jgi:hypothetical protein